MILRGIVDEDFVNYKTASMFVIFPYCSFKCNKDAGCDVCQNQSLSREHLIVIPANELVDRYVSNPITKSCVLGGLEPLDSAQDLKTFIYKFRNRCADTLVIYTGYTKEEVSNICPWLFDVKNVVIKFGRFVPNQPHHFDDVLGVELASPNQYAEAFNAD